MKREDEEFCRMQFHAFLSNLVAPSEMSWTFTILILGLGIALIVVAQYFAKKSEMV